MLTFQDVEKEMELQISMKQEIEVAMRILEKDIHEKQDTMISLRKQLEDIKGINLEMYQKLQVYSTTWKCTRNYRYIARHTRETGHDDLTPQTARGHQGNQPGNVPETTGI